MHGNTQYDPLVQKYAQQFGVDPDTLLSIMAQESSFIPSQQSRAGAQGLMQIMPGTQPELGITDPFDPEQSIRGGAQHYSRLLKKYGGNEERALQAYNFGEGHIDRGDPLPDETSRYAPKVQRRRDAYKMSHQRNPLALGSAEADSLVSADEDASLIEEALRREAEGRMKFSEEDSALLHEKARRMKLGQQPTPEAQPAPEQPGLMAQTFGKVKEGLQGGVNAMGQVADVIKPMVLPAGEATAGGVMGSLAMNALPAYRGYGLVRSGLDLGRRLLPATGETVGAYHGEADNQRLGITPPDDWNKLITGASALGGRVFGHTLQHAPRGAPGAAVGLNQGMMEEMLAIPQEQIRIPRPSAQVERLLAPRRNDYVSMPAFDRRIDDMIQQERNALPGLRDESFIRDLEQMQQGAAAQPPQYNQPTIPGTRNAPNGPPQLTAPGKAQGLTFEQVKASGQAFNREIDRSDGPHRGAYLQLKRSMYEDMEHMPAPQGSTQALWTEYRRAYRKEMAQQELAVQLQNNGLRSVGDGYWQINANPVINWMKHSDQRFWRESLNPGEYQQIEAILQDIQKNAPAINPRAGVHHGSGLVNKHLAASTLGGSVIGPTLGMSPQMGALAGTAAYMGIENLVSRALTSEPGRRALYRYVTANGGHLFDDAGAILGAAISEEFTQPDTPRTK